MSTTTTTTTPHTCSAACTGCERNSARNLSRHGCVRVRAANAAEVRRDQHKKQHLKSLEATKQQPSGMVCPIGYHLQAVGAEELQHVPKRAA
jgi:hypothetical protein